MDTKKVNGFGKTSVVHKYIVIAACDVTSSVTIEPGVLMHILCSQHWYLTVFTAIFILMHNTHVYFMFLMVIICQDS